MCKALELKAIKNKNNKITRIAHRLHGFQSNKWAILPSNSKSSVLLSKVSFPFRIKISRGRFCRLAPLLYVPYAELNERPKHDLCEMKYSLHPITLSSKDDEGLQYKRTAFLAETGARKAIHITIITTYGLTEKGCTASVQSEVTLNDLFKE